MIIPAWLLLILALIGLATLGALAYHLILDRAIKTAKDFQIQSLIQQVNEKVSIIAKQEKQIEEIEKKLLTIVEKKL